MKLSDWIAEKRGRRGEIARACGVSRQHIYNLERGRTLPDAEYCAAIFYATRGEVGLVDLRPDVDWSGFARVIARNGGKP